MKQLNLFDTNASSLKSRLPSLVMDREALIKWKQRVFKYQETIKDSQPQQQTLFEMPKSSWHTVDDIKPFELPIHNCLFWRMPEPKYHFADESSKGYLYFIIDNTLPILLYCGETKLTANQRWSGVHDCKDYIRNYIQLHRIHNLDVAVVSAFWEHIPPEKKILLKWERELIIKYRSPFNKESWKYWGQPFKKEWK
ncbi:excinuclease ABC subunit C [Crocosphaera watsonii]|nr:excinuclease ABC subunit C [Crocosphaera watsonii]